MTSFENQSLKNRQLKNEFVELKAQLDKQLREFKAYNLYAFKALQECKRMLSVEVTTFPS
ncbi:MAG TPA: hypothetical protein VM101_08180 [Flavitalea sp.]|nr:hypothetical protein [Flavitalea sp.]